MNGPITDRVPITFREINSHHNYKISTFFSSNKNLEFSWITLNN